MDNIETEGTGTFSSIVRTCNTDVSHQNRTYDLNLAKIPKAFVTQHEKIGLMCT